MIDTSIERWVDGQILKYSVDIFGNVYSWSYKQSGIKRMLTPHDRPDNKGYLTPVVRIGSKLNAKIRRVSHIVLETFVGPNPCKSKYYALHRNGDSTDNRLENLYWGTASQNAQDSIRHGTFNRSTTEANEATTLFSDDVIRILRVLWDAGYTSTFISSLFDGAISKAYIRGVGIRQKRRKVEELSPVEADDLLKRIKLEFNLS